MEINPIGDWTGGSNVDSGATNRKLGSDMGFAVTGGGLHGKDLSKVNATLVSSETFFTETRKTVKKGLSLYTKIAMRVVDSKRMGKIIHLKLS